MERTSFDFNVVQGNVSTSKFGTIRGIHYSLAKEGQAKWVSCVSGKIVDVIVDLRTNSPTFGKHEMIELEEASGKSIVIEPGLGHAFLALSDNSVVSYLLSSLYSDKDEFNISPFDTELNIDWKFPTRILTLSEKDINAPSLLKRKNLGQLPSLF
jgi:dTDP-4-dehydrorhamnose 3,5-epimerase